MEVASDGSSNRRLIDLVIDYTDDGKGTTRGRAGVGTWVTRAQFRNFRVASLEGKGAVSVGH